MRNKVRNIVSSAGRFQDGNPATGELGTIVTAQWLNEMQDFAQDTFDELKNVLALGDLTPNSAKKNQVAEAISIAIRNVRAVADSNARSLQNVIPNSKKSNSVTSSSSDTVATSYAVKQAYDLANGKQNPATTLAGYGITDWVVKSAEGDLNQLTTDGIYSFNSTHTTRNAPINASGHVMVMSGGRHNASWCRQIFKKHYSGETYERWQQASNSSEWSDWVRVDGVAWGEIRGVPSASLSQSGITQLDSSTNSTSETKAATPKAIKIVKDLIDALTRNLGNYIPNSKKSSSVSSTSSDTVATSYAVKTAYDKGVAAQNAADSANGNANNRVAKSGDTMSGILEIERADCFVRGKYRGQNSWFAGKGSANSDDISLASYVYNYGIMLKSDRIEAGKRLFVGSHAVPHSGDAYLDLSASHYGGVRIDRADRRDQMLIETNGNAFALIRRQRGSTTNHYVIQTPEKSGTVLLDNDFTYQKSGNFEIRKYPDGTMIQTYIYEQNDIYPERGEQTFAWAVAFAQRPLMFGQITTSYNSDHDCGINILSKSTQSRVYYHFYENGSPNQGLCRVQFLAIGRWK